jgi:hypothetical protein
MDVLRRIKHGLASLGLQHVHISENDATAYQHLPLGAVPTEHHELAPAHSQAQGNRVRRDDHPGSLHPAEGVPAPELRSLKVLVGGEVVMENQS